MRAKIVVGLAAAATLLAGCGSGGSANGSSTTPPPAAPSSAPPSSAAPSTAAPTSASPSPSAASAGPVTDPCTVVPASATKDLIGFTFAKAKAGSVAGSKLCSYVPAATDDPSLIAQEIALTGDFARFASTAEAQLPGAKTSPVKVAGADQAELVTAELSGTPTFAVLASAHGVFYQVIIGGPKLSPDDGKKAATTYAAALIKG